MKTLAIVVYILSAILATNCGSVDTNNSQVSIQPTETPVSTKPPPRRVEYIEVDLTVNGIRSGTKEDEVLRLLGKPIKVENNKQLNKCVGGYQRDIVYDGLKVILYGDELHRDYKVLEIKVTSARWGIDPGLRVGDPISKVRKLYGQPLNEEEGAYTFVTKDNLGLVAFEHKDGKVVRVLMRETLC